MGLALLCPILGREAGSGYPDKKKLTRSVDEPRDQHGRGRFGAVASNFLAGEDLQELFESALHFSKIQFVQALNQLEMAVTLGVGWEA